MSSSGATWGDLGRDALRAGRVSAREGDWTDLSRRQMARDGRRFEVLTPAEVRQHYPFLAAEDVTRWAAGVGA